ncbi:MAG: hypothetical protein Kow0056_03480 [Coriobacteriia bacterium]
MCRGHRWPRALKWTIGSSDIQSMIISEEQVRKVIEFVRSGGAEGSSSTQHLDIPSDLAARISECVRCAPDVREERVREAQARLASGVNPSDVADKMIARLVSDSLR